MYTSLSVQALIHLDHGDVDKADETMATMRPIPALFRLEFLKTMSRFPGTRALMCKARGDLELAEDLARGGVNYIWSEEYTNTETLVWYLSVLMEVLEAKGDTEAAREVREEMEELIEVGTRAACLAKMEKGSTD